MENTPKQDDEKITALLEKVFNLAELLLKLKDGLLEVTPDVERELANYGWYAFEGITVHSARFSSKARTIISY